MGTSFSTVPARPDMVSAVMITGKHPERYALARVAVDCFHAQTHGSRELVIVNTGDVRLWRGEPEVVEIMVEQAGLTLGELRNRALEAARGDWVIQWDDDDWHHPERIASQLAVAEPDAACVLGSRSAMISRAAIRASATMRRATTGRSCITGMRPIAIRPTRGARIRCSSGASRGGS